MDLTSTGTREVKQIHPKVNGELTLEVPASDARLARMPMVKQLPEAEEVKTVQRTKNTVENDGSGDVNDKIDEAEVGCSEWSEAWQEIYGLHLRQPAPVQLHVGATPALEPLGYAHFSSPQKKAK